jgi:hypothetical protein
MTARERLTGAVPFDAGDATPLPVVWHNDAGEPTNQRLSAISWAESSSTTDGQLLLGATGWQPAHGMLHFD